MKQLLSLFVALFATTALWASNTITYTATEQLRGYDGSLNVGATTFGPAITSHEFVNGTGTITCSGEITTIGDYAFCECTSLTSVTIPNSVTTIGYFAFGACMSLEQTHFRGTIAEWCDIQISDTSSNPIHYSHNFFINDMEVKDLIIPEGVDTIGDYAFYGCGGLTSVAIPNSVITIGEWAFCDCDGLTSVTIGNSVTTIEEGAFYFCTALNSLTIGNSITEIGYNAFYSCGDLTSITCYAANPPICRFYCFDWVDKSIPVYVPAQSVDAYKQADTWKEFTNILPIGAEEVPITEPVATTDNHSVTITWPQITDADTYTLEIKKNNELVCTLTFNSQGVMLNITFAAPARGGERTSSNAEMTGNGYRFTVTGLEAGADYTYAVTAKDASQQTLETYSGEFTTTGGVPTDVEQLTIDNGASAHSNKCTVRKFIRNKELQILRNGNLYNALGF